MKLPVEPGRMFRLTLKWLLIVLTAFTPPTAALMIPAEVEPAVVAAAGFLIRTYVC
jgi:hypothetical protein